jgi:hypothetical protein
VETRSIQIATDADKVSANNAVDDVFRRA